MTTTTTNMHLPKSRHITKETVEKLNYLEHHSDISNIIALPDFANDGIALSGLVFQSQDTLFPMGSGFDIGCGFSVFHIPKEVIDTQIHRLTLEFSSFASTLIGNNPCTPITQDDIKVIWNDPDVWLSLRGISSNTKKSLDFDNERPTSLSLENSVMSFGRIPKGNHFLEIRKISKILNENDCNKIGIHEGDYILHIHAGAGYYTEKSFIEYLSKFAANQTTPFETHGYEIHLPLEHEISKDYLSDAARSMNFAIANREILAQQVANWLQHPIKKLFENMHDKFQINKNKVNYQKAVQTYELLNGLPIAMLPSTIDQDSILVKGTGAFEYLNHGTGDGEGGKLASLDGLLTNLTETPNRLFYSMEECYQYALKQNWFTPICKIQPWLSIKNNRKW
ncbi:RtcB family protein [Bacillus bombysepticus]|uniref:RtcB family protein n=1 Tax=Bacillus bombysepticus TaxID=658666 RepID=UPI00301A0256